MAWAEQWLNLYYKAIEADVGFVNKIASMFIAEIKHSNALFYATYFLKIVKKEIDLPTLIADYIMVLGSKATLDMLNIHTTSTTADTQSISATVRGSPKSMDSKRKKGKTNQCVACDMLDHRVENCFVVNEAKRLKF